MAIHPSDSATQRRAELELIAGASIRLGSSLVKRTIAFDDGVSIEIDGWNDDEKILCEAYARIGALAAGQQKKLGTDILKLVTAERRLGGSWRKVLVVAGQNAFLWLTGKCWQAAAVRDFGIEVLRVKLSDELGREVIRAQASQTMTNPFEAGSE